MKLINQFTILKKNLRDIDYVTREKVDFWKNNEKSVQHKSTVQFIVIKNKYF